MMRTDTDRYVHTYTYGDGRLRIRYDSLRVDTKDISADVYDGVTVL